LSCSGSTYSVPGVLCDANHDGQPDPGVVCQENACVATGVFVDLPLLSAQEYGQPLRFDFTVTGWYDGLGVRGFGWADGATISHVNDNLFRYYQATTSNDLGAQTVEIEAYPVAGLNGDDDPVATATRSVTFTCQASNQCCANAHWQPEYATCTYNDDPNGGACQWSGNLLTCQPYCTETSEVRCDGDRLYAVDSCGALTAQIEDCGAAGLVCRDNACQR